MSTAPSVRKTLAPRLGRADRSALGRWFWELDRVLLFMVAVLIVIGLIAVAAASPAASQRYSGTGFSLPPLYYFYRQLMWIALAVPVMILVSMLPSAPLMLARQPGTGLGPVTRAGAWPNRSSSIKPAASRANRRSALGVVARANAIPAASACNRNSWSRSHTTSM